MSDELRMALADCGSPEALIAAILKHHPEWTPPVPLLPLAESVGIAELRELETTSKFEGALVDRSGQDQWRHSDQGRHLEQRRRFTIGHELGHFLLPSHRGNRQCTSDDLRETRRDTQHRRQEAEANRFSAGLLMPKPWFVREMEKLGEADVTHVQLLAKQYQTSLEATANRYIDLTDDTCALVFSKDNVVRYVRRTTNFPFLSLKTNDPLPSGCAVSRHTPVHPLRVASEWLENSRKRLAGNQMGRGGTKAP